jgi:ribosome recycling factor
MYEWRPRMQKIARQLAEQLNGIRTGTVDRGVIETIRVDCQGKTVSISRLGVLKLQGDRILIVPFERANVPAIIKSLGDSRMSAYAVNPTTVCVSVPPMSVEQRNDIVRHVKKLGEEAKIAVRGIRQQGRKQIEASGRGSLRAVQEATDTTIDEIEELIKAKVADLS